MGCLFLVASWHKRHNQAAEKLGLLEEEISEECYRKQRQKQRDSRASKVAGNVAECREVDYILYIVDNYLFGRKFGHSEDGVGADKLVDFLYRLAQTCLQAFDVDVLELRYLRTYKRNRQHNEQHQHAPYKYGGYHCRYPSWHLEASKMNLVEKLDDWTRNRSNETRNQQPPYDVGKVDAEKHQNYQPDKTYDIFAVF